MEENIQTIIGAIVSVFLLFIFPVYMAYEKKDDISYALAMKVTQEFVDDVRNKGYLTKEMYTEYKADLLLTGCSYDVELTHNHTRIDPVARYYSIDEDTGVRKLVKSTSQEEKEKYESLIVQNAINNNRLNLWSTDEEKQLYIDIAYLESGINQVINTYIVAEEVYSTKHIESVLNTENKLWLNANTEDFVCVDDEDEEDLESLTKRVKNCSYAYTMNENDNFNVIIKNTNKTMATLIYNMVTVNTIDNNVRIYVNYGGTILNERWRGKIDYSKMKHDDLNLYDFEEYTVFLEAKEYRKDQTGDEEVFISDISAKEEYDIEFETKPFEVTDLREKGYYVLEGEVELYNLAVGMLATIDDSLAISVGLNGISLIVTNSNTYEPRVILSYPEKISGYRNIKVKVKKSDVDDTKYVAILYVDNKKVAESLLLESAPRINTIGEGYLGIKDNQYAGYIRNVKVNY